MKSCSILHSTVFSEIPSQKREECVEKRYLVLQEKVVLI